MRLESSTPRISDWAIEQYEGIETENGNAMPGMWNAEKPTTQRMVLAATTHQTASGLRK